VHSVRLHAAAELYLFVFLSREEAGTDAALRPIWSGIEGALFTQGIKEEVVEALDKILAKHAPALQAHWLGMVKDALRLQQGKDSWPNLPEKAVRLGGVTYDESCDVSQITEYYTRSWSVMAAAVASLVNSSHIGSGSGEGTVNEDVCRFLFAVVDTAIQASTESRGGAGLLSGSNSGPQPGCASVTPTALFGAEEEFDEHMAAVHYLIALDALLRHPYTTSTAPRLTPMQATSLLRALAHGAFLRPDSSYELQAVSVRVFSHLLASNDNHPGVIHTLLATNSGSSNTSAADQAEKHADSTASSSGGSSNGGEMEEEEGSLWEAVLEVVMVPLRRAVPTLFTSPSGVVPRSFGVEVDADDEEDEEDQGLPIARALSSPLFLSCMVLLAYLPALCPPQEVEEMASSMMAVALR